MSKLLKSQTLKEGEFLNRWFDSRIRNNKNVLLAISGSTGSGKTYSCLSTGEEWYKYYFKEQFPDENVCFGLSILAKRINDLHKEGKLRKGELFILEEAGANLSNLDFQQKLAKMFNYILQSFRSMNLIILMNLPVLTMLNKSARQLIHAHFITCGIDYDRKMTKVKPYFHQLNQNTGKSYWKYPRVRIKNKIVTLQRLNFVKPSDRIIRAYEYDKSKFVFNLTQDFVEEAERRDKKTMLKMSRDNLTDNQRRVLDLISKGYKPKEVALKIGCSDRNIRQYIKVIEKKGYDIRKFYKNEKKGFGNMPETRNAIT